MALLISGILAGSACAQVTLGHAFNVRGDLGQWQPFVDLTGRAGGLVEGGEAALFLPLVQTDGELLFADLRGKLFDDDSTEGNWGLAYRQLHDTGWILGSYAFYDLRKTPSDNYFSQGVLGLEALNYQWDFRINGYLGEDGAKASRGVARAVMVDTQVVVVGGFERTYSGADIELGKLLWASDPESALADIELRVFAGGFYFYNDAPGFPETAGPRARVELRAYDVDWLGKGSRLVLSGTLQHDAVRKSQSIASLQVRVPFGPGGHRRRLGRLKRRMVDPIQRDVDVVTSPSGMDAAEAALINGQPMGTISFVNASNQLPADIAEAGAGNTVIVNGTGSTIDLSTVIQLREGQHVLSGGHVVEIRGASSGAVGSFRVPGTRAVLNGTSQAADVFQIANRATISGFTVTGGTTGIFGHNATGFLIANNHVSGALGSGFFKSDGVRLTGITAGNIIGNTSVNNTATVLSDGFHIERFSGGLIRGNTASGNSKSGFDFEREGGVSLAGGTVSGNVASGNGGLGFEIGGMTGGIVSGNMAVGNGDDGFAVVDFSGGQVIHNVALNNQLNGFEIGSFNNGAFDGTWVHGSVVGNRAENNANAGFLVRNRTGGTAGRNTASGNDDNTLPTP